MNEMITVTEKDGIQAVSARELHKGLGISKRFSEWFSVNSKDFVENEDFSRAYLKVQANRYGGEQTIEDYAISIEMAKAICLMSKTEKGKEYRQYLIKLEQAWNTPEAVMARALQLANKTLETYKEKVSIMQPKADVYDHFIDNSATFNFQETAKQLGFSKATPVINFLAKQGYCYRQENKVLATERGLKEELLKEIDYQSKRTGHSGAQTRLTIKGQQYLLNNIEEIKEFIDTSRGA